MIENYLHKFSNLRTDTGRERYPAFTLHRAAHKPFLLLSIMDLIAQGSIAENFIEPSFELVDTFNGYWNSIMPVDRKGIMSYTFYHMRSEPLWQLIPNEGYKDQSGMTVSSSS